MSSPDRDRDATSPEATPGALIKAAERLMAEQGVYAVSLREINRASGARNTMALAYHFKDRAGLIRAILNRHAAGVEIARHALLDAYEATGAADARTLAAALVRPLAAKLSDPDNGRQYLQVYAELVQRADPIILEAPLTDSTDSMFRLRKLLDPLFDDLQRQTHQRYAALRYTFVELSWRARSAPHDDDRFFVSHLIDMVTGLLTAEMSDETRFLAAERDYRRGHDDG
jgi:AcrR family transcriptional regulator